MPTYQYACTACGHRFEAVQSFSDAALTACPECEGQLRKVFSSVGIVFKGSGFYRTDSRDNKSSTSTSTSEPTSAKTETPAASASESSGSTNTTASTSTPAPSAPATAAKPKAKKSTTPAAK